MPLRVTKTKQDHPEAGQSARRAATANETGATSVDPMLAEVVMAAALRGERLVCVIRAVSCAFLLFRLLSTGLASTPQTLLSVSALAVAIGFTAWLLGRIRETTADYRWLGLSVSVDAGFCFAFLLETVLWPRAGEAYEGLLKLPDVALLLVAVYAAGFRVWPRLALQGALLNLLCFSVLLAVERAVHGERLGYSAAEVTLPLFLLGCVMLLSIATAWRTAHFVTDGARAALHIHCARRKLTDLVRDHHDARSLISAAAVSSDLLLRALEQGKTAGVPAEDDVRRHGERLRLDLAAARRQLAELGDKAYDQLTALSDVESVETTRVVTEAVEALRWRFPELHIDAELDRVPDVLVAGGAASMQRILYNLVNNAREGDGRAGASRIAVRATAEAGMVRLVVEDDGPGFPNAAVGPVSSKPAGMGLGLIMMSELLRASGGTLEKDNRGDGGARVCLTLPSVEVVGVPRMH